jgi:hypothetical protein
LDTAIYLPEQQEPELMYRFVDTILVDSTGVIKWATEVSW